MSELDFQSILLRQLNFWIDQGALWLPACELAIPEGVMHPDILRQALGDDPGGRVVVQPVRRPLDGRHGEHAFRAYRHLELVVLLRDRAVEGLDLGLAALAASGLELADHDIRCVDRLWDSTALDAQGNGWQVEVDGAAVARWTFLRTLAGYEPRRPTAVWVVGLEQLASVVCGLPAVDVPWSTSGGSDTDAAPRVGTMLLGEERERCRWAEDTVDTEILWQRLEEGDRATRRALATELPRIAYEQAISALEIIDALTLRGALRPRERGERVEKTRLQILASAELVVASMAEASDESDSGTPAEDGMARAEGEVETESHSAAESEGTDE